MNGNSNINAPNPAEADAGVKPARACAPVPLADGDCFIESIAKERSNQVGATVKSPGQPNKGGRPRKSYDYLIGTTHNFLVIDRIFRGAGHEPYAATTCTRCDTHSECRLRDILNGHTKSCKCLRPEQYIINVKEQVKRLPEQNVAEMWAMHYAGATRLDIAWKHKLAVVVVDFALRRYQRFLDGYINRGLALSLAGQTLCAVPAKVAEYLRKSERRVQNLFRRARKEEAETNAGSIVEGRKLRQWAMEHSQLIPFNPDEEVEIG